MGKDDLGKRVYNEARLAVAAENRRKYVQLSSWMQKHFDDIFAEAPNNELYAVGVWKREKPEVHYFRNYEKGALRFISRCAKEGETNTYLIYRHQRDGALMLAATG